MRIASIMLAVSALFASVSAHATGGHKPPVHDCKPDCLTTLTFSNLLDKKTTYVYKDTDAGGDATVTADSGKLVVVGGELGVATGGLLGVLDPRLGKGESITVSFAKTVSLLYWDMDDLPLGSNKFSLSVDGATPLLYSLDSHTTAPLLTGKSFKFGYAGDAYFIDSLKFVCEVPEPETYALMVAGLLTAGVMRRRQQRG
ncbi:PEP-CTERM sorting domain-containing protein [Aquabacterium olei]|nr:PEP-CTERM sorting domain-containing protein [Aquabacterium olei]